MLTIFRNSFLEKIIKSNFYLLYLVSKIIDYFKFIFLPYEPEWHFFKNFPISKKSIIIDVGAHRGESIFLFNKYYPNNIVYSFEPIKYLSDILKKKFPKSKIFNYGLSQKKNNKIFYPTLNGFDLTLWSSTSKKNLLNRFRNFTNIKTFINIKQVDCKFKNFFFIKKKISIIKFDCEGDESEALNALMKIVKRDYPVIFYEYHEHNYESFKNKLYKIGYKVFFYNNKKKILLKFKKISEFSKLINRESRAINLLFLNKKFIS